VRIIYHDSNKVVVRTDAARTFVWENGDWRRTHEDHPVSNRMKTALTTFLYGAMLIERSKRSNR